MMRIFAGEMRNLRFHDNKKTPKKRNNRIEIAPVYKGLGFTWEALCLYQSVLTNTGFLDTIKP